VVKQLREFIAANDVPRELWPASPLGQCETLFLRRASIPRAKIPASGSHIFLCAGEPLLVEKKDLTRTEGS
jgi:hypothetical protein